MSPKSSWPPFTTAYPRSEPHGADGHLAPDAAAAAAVSLAGHRTGAAGRPGGGASADRGVPGRELRTPARRRPDVGQDLPELLAAGGRPGRTGVGGPVAPVARSGHG